jgi:membrane protein
MARAARRLAGSTLGDTFLAAYQTRLQGLAAEASFWGVFALPWLLLGLIAGVSRMQGLIGIDVLTRLYDEIVGLADQVLTQEAIDDLLVPMLDEVLVRGRTALGLLGAAVAIWAGSRVLDTLVDGMTIVYRREGLRGYLHTRLVSIGLYAAALLGLIVAIPLIVAGPTFLVRLVPGAQGFITSVLLVGLEIGTVLVLVVSLYHWAVPHRTRWHADIPGALIAMALWVVFSFLLRWYFAWLFREGSVYGVISAPIAVMMWTYVTFVALLLGAAFNGALAVRRGWFVHPDSPDQEAAATGGDVPGIGHDDRRSSGSVG